MSMIILSRCPVGTKFWPRFCILVSVKAVRDIYGAGQSHNLKLIINNRSSHRCRNSCRRRWLSHHSHQAPSHWRPRRCRTYRRSRSWSASTRPCNPPRRFNRHSLQFQNLSALRCVPRGQRAVLLRRWVIQTHKPLAPRRRRLPRVRLPRRWILDHLASRY